MLYDFDLAERRLRPWKRPGESYEHALMKALGYAMFVGEYPGLEIERPVGLRYTPDLVARSGAGRRIHFWGECGLVTMRKVAWLLKHGGVERLVIFKTDCGVRMLAEELRATIDERYRPPQRLLIINFVSDITLRAASRRIAHVPHSWYTRVAV